MRYLIALLAALLYASLLPGCATVDGAVDRTITMGQNCAIQAGRDVASDAVIAVESAVAQASFQGAQESLLNLAAIYGGAFVSCAVESVVSQSKMNMARAGDVGSSLDSTKVVNGQGWLADHPVPR